jgi:hypothetical protein
LHWWIWYRVEGIDPALIHARDELAMASLEKDRLCENKLEAEEHLQLMYVELEGLDDDDGDAVATTEYRQQQAIVDVAEEAAVEAEEAHDLAVGCMKKASAKVNRLEGLKRHGRAYQDVWMLVENKLKADYKVHHSAYHGGDLEGNQCRELMKQAPAVMNAVKEIVLEHITELPAEEKAKRADETEVDLFCSAFQRLFQYFDVVSHYCYQPYGSLSDRDLVKLELGVDRLVDLYLKLLPNCPMKLHMIANHLVPHMKRFRGLKSHHESHIERAHQQGVRDSRRLGVLGSYERKTVSALKTEATGNKAEVMAMVADTNQKKIKRPGRKRKAADALLEEKGAPPAGGSRQEYLNGVLELPAIVAEFPSLLELAKLSMGAD